MGLTTGELNERELARCRIIDRLQACCVKYQLVRLQIASGEFLGREDEAAARLGELRQRVGGLEDELLEFDRRTAVH